jgi:hypothetical protein
VKEAEGEVQVEVTVGGKRIIRKRKLPEHDDVTVGTLSLQNSCLRDGVFIHVWKLLSYLCKYKAMPDY